MPCVILVPFSIIRVFPVESPPGLCQGVTPLFIVPPLMVHVPPLSVPPYVLQSADKLTEHNILIAIDESRILGLFIFDFLEVVGGGGSGICHYSSYSAFHFFLIISKIWAELYKKFTYF
ncbi:hypothetical protein [Campylobacter lanienae]|uniref:hypothetical protein n=1 Tax=Campylobacter lanienae TaxID=75658 RepID=UPI0011C4CC64|nr:hypothetical protein [Campylobacter lanienae]